MSFLEKLLVGCVSFYAEDVLALFQVDSRVIFNRLQVFLSDFLLQQALRQQSPFCTIWMNLSFPLVHVSTALQSHVFVREIIFVGSHVHGRQVRVFFLNVHQLVL